MRRSVEQGTELQTSSLETSGQMSVLVKVCQVRFRPPYCREWLTNAYTRTLPLAAPASTFELNGQLFRELLFRGSLFAGSLCRR